MVWIALSWVVLVNKLLWQYVQSTYFIDILNAQRYVILSNWWLAPSKTKKKKAKEKKPGENVLKGNRCTLFLSGKWLEGSSMFSCDDLIAPDKFQVKIYFSKVQNLRVSLILSQAVTLFTLEPALEEREMPKLVSVHKNEWLNTPAVYVPLGGRERSHTTQFAMKVSSTAPDQAACVDICGRLAWATHRCQRRLSSATMCLCVLFPNKHSLERR